jgi:hypothetical protein
MNPNELQEFMEFLGDDVQTDPYNIKVDLQQFDNEYQAWRNDMNE